MYTSQNFQILDEETFSLRIPTDRDYKILQLTDLHLGFGMFSGKKDRLALAAVTELVRRTRPDLIVLTGDSVFPFFPKSGTMNNRKQAQKLLAFLDGFQIPYTFVFGNHDCEMGAACNKEQLAEIFKENGCTSAEVCEDAEEAFRKALSEKGDDGLLFCVGSLYLVGEIKTAILKGIGK